MFRFFLFKKANSMQISILGESKQSQVTQNESVGRSYV